MDWKNPKHSAGDIGKDSPLETCYYLGKMLERNYPLSKVDRKKDVASKFPVLGYAASLGSLQACQALK